MVNVVSEETQQQLTDVIENDAKRKEQKSNDEGLVVKKKGKRNRDDEKYVAPPRSQPRKKQRLISKYTSFSRVVFFGTSSASPLPSVRNVSSLGVQLDSGDLFLVDCGEGTQCQLMRSTIKTSRIKAVLFTHLHGDHCYGIFGLIKMLSHNGRANPLWIVGPVGIKRMVLTVLYCSGGWSVDDSGRFRLVFHELPSQRERVIYLKDTETYIPGLTIHAAPMQHLCMPTYGYIIQESIKPGKLDGEKARALGASGKQLGVLKAGKDVILENGVVVKSEDVLGTPARPRRVAVLLDTSDASSALPHCRDVDLLIHEATYDDTMRKKAIAHGHSTGVMAAEFANKCNAKRLVLTHFSCRYRSCGTPGLPQVTDLEDEALKVAKCPVTIACDFKCFSGKMFAPEKVLALQFKELVVLQARENHSKTTAIAGIQRKEVYENRKVDTKETMNISNDSSTDNTKDVKESSMTASEKDTLLTCSAEACANGEMAQLKTLPNNYQGKNIAEVTS